MNHSSALAFSGLLAARVASDASKTHSGGRRRLGRGRGFLQRVGTFRTLARFVCLLGCRRSCRLPLISHSDAFVLFLFCAPLPTYDHRMYLISRDTIREAIKRLSLSVCANTMDSRPFFFLFFFLKPAGFSTLYTLHMYRETVTREYLCLV